MKSTARKRTYKAWWSMMNRCTNPQSRDWVYYGGRGISVCLEWYSFGTFLKDMGEAPAGKSLDRRENNSNYEPTNCRWATWTEQARNRRSARFLEVNGMRRSVSEWAQYLNISRRLIFVRLSRGWTPERALSSARKWSAHG